MLFLKTTSLTGRREIQKALPFVTLSQASGHSGLEGTHADNYISIPSSATANFNQSESGRNKTSQYYTNLCGRLKDPKSSEGTPKSMPHLEYIISDMVEIVELLNKFNLLKTMFRACERLNFSRDALNPLTELSTMYNASITTVGNVIFWPGQKVYIDPMGDGPHRWPALRCEFYSRRLGIGGILYHSGREVIG